MFTVQLSVLVAVICETGTAEDAIMRHIYNGLPSRRNEFPYVVRICNKTDKYHPLCTGSIIATNHVLTAGHCCQETGPKIKVFGDKCQKRFYEERKNLSTRYLRSNDETILHDVCVLRLKRSMNASEDGDLGIHINFGRLFARKCTSIGYGETEKLIDELMTQLHHKEVFAEAAWRGTWLNRLYAEARYSELRPSPLPRVVTRLANTTMHICMKDVCS